MDRCVSEQINILILSNFAIELIFTQSFLFRGIWFIPKHEGGTRLLAHPWYAFLTTHSTSPIRL